MDKKISEKLKSLPKIDQLLECGELTKYYVSTQREIVADAARRAVDKVREVLLSGSDADVSLETVAKIAAAFIDKEDKPSLRRIINGTGIILHTNLGRAKLASSAAESACEIAKGYSTLEFSLKTGERGSRHDHCSKLIAEVTGAEDAIAVNNNASATLLTLMGMASGKEVIVSRGELVEIGGSFRVPEIMELGGAKLKDIGTTNKTHLFDYERAINENTGAILKVHTSNYRILGFTEDVPAKELAKLAHKHGLPFIYDLGSGLLEDLHTYGLDEPTVGSAIADGADLVLFSGDKLLGGPQAGIIAGKKEYVDILKKNPMARAVRLDKMILASLEETFRIYRDKREAFAKIPVLNMITTPIEDVISKAKAFASVLSAQNLNASFSVSEEIGRVGGGSAPCLDLKTAAVAVVPTKMNADQLMKALRDNDMPIIARISEGRVLLDMRTIADDELSIVKQALINILK